MTSISNNILHFFDVFIFEAFTFLKNSSFYFTLMNIDRLITFPDLLSIIIHICHNDDTYLVQWPRLFSCWHRRWETESELDHPVLLCYSLSHHPSSKDLKLERAGQGGHTCPAWLHHTRQPGQRARTTSQPCPTSVQRKPGEHTGK